MNLSQKQAFILELVRQIDDELATLTKIARDAADAVTHEENRAEGNKDMRSTEASYIARGQAERAIELERHRARLTSFELREFPDGASIEAGAVIELLHQGKKQLYFMLPVAGGRTADVGGKAAATITPTSPLGSALLGLEKGDEAEVAAPGKNRLYEILSVS